MKLLLDENLAPRLAIALGDLYPDSRHVRDVNLLGATDAIVWEHAREQGYTIVTKDSDFHQRSVLFGAPPKVVWIRLGNRPTAAVERIRRERHAEIERFGIDPEAAILVLG